MNKLIAIIALTIVLAGTVVTAYAAQVPTPKCTTVYGGGQGSCLNNAAKQQNKAGFVAPNQGTTNIQYTQPSQTTKGGLQVSQPQQTQTMPPTGPESLPLVSLVIAGSLGIYIRTKTASAA